jgi:protease-4
MLNEIHGNFIDAVNNERGERLSKDPIVFSGMIFTGSKSIELGMSDAYGSVHSVARNFFEVENIVDYTVPSSLIERFSEQLKSSFGKDLLSTLLDSGGRFPIH